MSNKKRIYAPRGGRVPHLREWRERAMISQRELGNRATDTDGKAVHWVTISRLERGGVASWNTIKRLAKALGIDARWLVESSPPSPPSPARLNWNETKLAR